MLDRPETEIRDELSNGYRQWVEILANMTESQKKSLLDAIYGEKAPSPQEKQAIHSLATFGIGEVSLRLAGKRF